jgi:ribosomal protein L29
MAPKKDTSSENLEKDLYILRMKKLAGELKATHELSRLRKNIARKNTTHTN